MIEIRKYLRLYLLLFLMVTSCSTSTGGTNASATPSSVPLASPTPLPAAEVTFNVLPPAGMSPDATLLFTLFDPIAGSDITARSYPMSRQSDGRWQVKITPHVGSVLHYRYQLQSNPPVDEWDASGHPVEFRLAFIPGPASFDDMIAAWDGDAYSGFVGRVMGQIVDGQTSEPLAEMLVSASGMTSFSDGEGKFRIEGLPVGLHNMVILSPDGAYEPAQQGAIVAEESTTPAMFRLNPAQPVNVTFEVAVPTDTIPGTPVRVAGNTFHLGNLYCELAGGVYGSNTGMPTLQWIGEGHYTLTLTLYAGMVLNYRYTLGDGLWNAERAPDGGLLTRRVVLPATDLVLEDTVSNWGGGKRGNIFFYASVPENTPPGDVVSLQLKTTDWFEPLPMWALSDSEWYYVLYSPLPPNQSIAYRYCRNQQCGQADDVDTAGPDAAGRQLTMAVGNQDIKDQVLAWVWWEADTPSVPVIAPEIASSPGFEAGFEFVPLYQPSWKATLPQSLAEIASSGANAVILTPIWTISHTNPIPVFAFDPTYSPYDADLRDIIQQAQTLGLQVVLHPSFHAPELELEDWWQGAVRDVNWWSVWFEQYEVFIRTMARQAESHAVSKLVLGGPEVAPALPGGQLADGIQSGVPGDAEARWRAIIEGVRSLFSGRLAFEIELGEALQPPPAFIDVFDEVHIYWHAPLAADSEPTITSMQEAASNRLLTTLAEPSLADLPIQISVEYLSVDGSARACAMAPDQTCRPPAVFDQGSVVDTSIEVDLVEQAQAINAVLLEAYNRPQIMGFYVRRYHPIIALQDKSASVQGKPIWNVLVYWYPRLTSE